MEVILLETIPKVGEKFEKVSVADGYGFNYLVPQGLARVATPHAMAELHQAREEYKKQREQKEKEISAKISSLENAELVIKGKANEQGHLFAGIHASDVAEAFREKYNIDIKGSHVDLQHALKEVGHHKLKIIVGEEAASLTVMIESAE